MFEKRQKYLQLELCNSQNKVDEYVEVKASDNMYF